MATLAARLISLAQAVGGDIKALTTKVGALTSLTTTDKTNLVAAINEVKASVGSAGAAINDTAGDGVTTVTWSANKIFDEIAAAKLALKNELTNGASTTLDTLSELASALGNDPNYATTIATAMGNRIRYDAPQTLTAAQVTQAGFNIGIGEPDTDLVASYTTAKT